MEISVTFLQYLSYLYLPFVPLVLFPGISSFPPIQLRSLEDLYTGLCYTLSSY